MFFISTVFIFWGVFHYIKNKCFIAIKNEAFASIEHSLKIFGKNDVLLLGKKLLFTYSCISWMEKEKFIQEIRKES